MAFEGDPSKPKVERSEILGASAIWCTSRPDAFEIAKESEGLPPAWSTKLEAQRLRDHSTEKGL